MIVDPLVAKVANALTEAGLPAEIVDRAEAESAIPDPGALAQALVYLVADHPVIALIAGDRRCQADQLARVFNLKGDARAADAAVVAALTGYPAGGVAPIATARPVRIVLDASLKRFPRLLVPAGHPDRVFAVDMNGLKRLTKGIVSYAVAGLP